eukprot:1183005-Pyramimonas_sp.AAC.1
MPCSSCSCVLCRVPVCFVAFLRALTCSCVFYVFCRAPSAPVRSTVLLCVLTCSCVFCRAHVFVGFCRAPVFCRAPARSAVLLRVGLP